MRAKILLLLCAQALSAHAQPDFDRNYCGFAPNDSIDLTNDGIPDLVVQGFRNGTDDEPSSSGTCSEGTTASAQTSSVDGPVKPPANTDSRSKTRCSAAPSMS